MTAHRQPLLPAPQPRTPIALNELGLAPENLRFAEPEDDDVPRLAETIAAAGLIYPLMVRKGRRGEAPYMVLDGRRRRFALLRLAAEDRLPADHPVECVLAEGRAAQAAAAVLPNAEHAPVHLADVILAIGKLRRTRLSTAAIADALGYDEVEVRRLEAMAGVHDEVLAAFRLGKLSLRQVRLFARLKEPERQAELARQALNGWFNESALQSVVVGGRVTPQDPRFALVGEAVYAGAGGRMAADLFGELETEVLDPEILDACWRAEAERLSQPLADAGLDLAFSRERGFAAPEGLTHLPFVHWGSLDADRRAAFDQVRERLESATEALAAAGPEARDAAVAEVLAARLALARLSAGCGEVVAALLTPVRDGLDVTFYCRPAASEPEPEAPEGLAGLQAAGRAAPDDGSEPASEPEPQLPAEVEGVSHALHAARTDVLTRGLAADLADAPETALIVLIAHLFGQVTGYGRSAGDTALRLRAFPRSGDPADPICGGLWSRLEAQADAYEASGLTPLAFTAGLEAEVRGQLLADLVAGCLDLTEPRTDQIRRGARAEGVAIAALCGSDLARRWRPEAAFLSLHTGGQLMSLLDQMGAPPPKARALRKSELVQIVAEAAAAKGWIPSALRWPHLPAADPDLPEAAEPADPSVASA